MLVLVLTPLLLGPGCNYLPASRQAQQYQVENERLLSEFRAQKKRAEELQVRNTQLAKRVDESERLLATLQNGGPSSRVSSTDQSSRRLNPAGLSPQTPGLFSDPSSLGSPASSANGQRSTDPSPWRPISRSNP